MYPGPAPVLLLHSQWDCNEVCGWDEPGVVPKDHESCPKVSAPISDLITELFNTNFLQTRKMQKNQREIKRIHEEIKEDYAFAVKKSVVDFVLKEPEIDEDERFLDEDDETPMTIELAAVSEAWKKLYRSSKRHLNHHLHLINQCMLQAQVGAELDLANLI